MALRCLEWVTNVGLRRNGEAQNLYRDIGFYLNGLWKDYQLADFGRRLLDEYGIDEPIDGLFIFLEAKGKKRAI